MSDLWPIPPPDSLDSDGASEWNRAMDLLAGKPIDTTLLTAYCQTHSRWVHAEAQIQKYGAVIKSPTGKPVSSPYLQIAKDALRSVRSLSADLGIPSQAPKEPAPQAIAVEPVGDILPEAAEAWDKICDSKVQPRMLSALRRVCAGATIREARIAEGYASHSEIAKHCKRFGLLKLTTRSIIDQHRSIAKLSAEEMERRLHEKPEEIPTNQLAVIGGISTDKVLSHEKQAKDDGSTYLSALEAMAKRVAESGAELELKVTVKPKAEEPPKDEVISPSGEVIDVTPTDAADSTPPALPPHT